MRGVEYARVYCSMYTVVFTSSLPSFLQLWLEKIGPLKHFCEFAVANHLSRPNPDVARACSTVQLSGCQRLPLTPLIG